MHKGWYTLFVLAVMCAACSGSRPANLGVADGTLAPCPDSPNCVSSESKDAKHFIDPIPYEGTLEGARGTLISVIESMQRSRIVTHDPTYIHVEFTSAVFRFVDDVEFSFDDAAKIIHVRSASRVGYSDFGVNRKRMETIRRTFAASAGVKE
jgi:uncharacterized protein (DUF1499 family)